MRIFFTIFFLFNLNLPNLFADKIEHKSCQIGVPTFNNWNLNSANFSDFNHQLYQLKGPLKEMYDIAERNAKSELLKLGYRVYYINIPAETLFSKSANEAYKKEYNDSPKNKDKLYFSYNVNFNSTEKYRRNRPSEIKARANSTVEIYLGKNLVAMKTKELRSNLFSSKKWQVLLEKSVRRTVGGLPKCKKF